MKLTLAKQKNKTQLADQYQKQGFVKVSNALSESTLSTIHEFIDKQAQWNLALNHHGKHQDFNNLEVAKWSEDKKQQFEDVIFAQASDGFQYLYEAIPIYDIFTQNLLADHFFNDIVRFLNTEATLDFFREILAAPQITFMDAQLTRFGAGHFLNTHNDKNRVAAMVINLTKQWRPDWGGALHLLDDEQQIEQSFLPSFNEINIFKIPRDHYVGYVSPFATGKRLAITCWLRSGENPLVKSKS
ncbi:MAG: hypothetical protein COB83_08230 [Gammaproteobacteria bacterium]|nr:MAG: hypothetical protein COB83_08230 [Gammaproteobacteria bacterium]